MQEKEAPEGAEPFLSTPAVHVQPSYFEPTPFIREFKLAGNVKALSRGLTDLFTRTPT